jgi:hypothetical protein
VSGLVNDTVLFVLACGLALESCLECLYRKELCRVIGRSRFIRLGRGIPNVWSSVGEFYRIPRGRKAIGITLLMTFSIAERRTAGGDVMVRQTVLER